jgi:glycosyltransferase involved in cell wall biosynthesis
MAQIEIVVIDSSPDGETADVVKRYSESLPVRLLLRPDLGPWTTKTNLGVELASADHVCILHQDDLWLPGRVNAIRRWLTECPEAVLHLAPSVYVDRTGRRIGQWRCPLPAEQSIDRGLLLERLLVQNFISVPAPVIQRRAWLSSGGMDEQLWYTADWDLWLKLATEGPVLYHNEITTAFRIHGSSQTVSGSRDSRAFREQMQTVLERHIHNIPESRRRAVEPAARASINVNVMLASAAAGSFKALVGAAANVASLGFKGIKGYFRDSRLHERILSRVFAKAVGAF